MKTTDFSVMPYDRKPKSSTRGHALQVLAVYAIILVVIALTAFLSGHVPEPEHAKAAEVQSPHEIVQAYENQTRDLCQDWLAKHH